MTQDNPCLAYRIIKSQAGLPMIEAQGWTTVIHNKDVRSAALDLRYFPVDGELITVAILCDEINVRHDLLTELNRPIPIPVNLNNVKLAAMLEFLWHYAAAAAMDNLGGPADSA